MALGNNVVMNTICSHQLKNRVVTVTHEIVCKLCGAVIGMDNSQEIHTESIVNLFQEIQPGCKPVKLLSSIRIHESKFSSSSFSNACDKLNLPRYVSLDAWNIFSKLMKQQKIRKKCTIKSMVCKNSKIQNTTNLSNGMLAMFSLFISCRRFGVAKSDSQIQQVVKFSFLLKQLPTMLKIFSLIKPIADDLGIKSDTDHLEYYLNVYFQKFTQSNMLLPNRIKHQARVIADVIPGTNESKARIAVKIVLAGLGIKFV
jgi:hypothetical protein